MLINWLSHILLKTIRVIFDLSKIQNSLSKIINWNNDFLFEKQTFILHSCQSINKYISNCPVWNITQLLI